MWEPDVRGTSIAAEEQRTTFGNTVDDQSAVDRSHSHREATCWIMPPPKRRRHEPIRLIEQRAAHTVSRAIMDTIAVR